ncbi:hypothetical protein OHB31_18705 [Streptomyces microflavus]|uniref:hypothetical protein n=1 Tax=Streptomyces griseus group TaxID=629295 RepID=UPI002DDAF82C|nr:hypothetical protein [Streptomyces microflavus]WSA62065.1 hypothetical protein OHB31_18705 [Streptomyces microflavus]
MAKRIRNGYLEQFDGEDGPVLPLAYWPELEESDAWDEWMEGGTWVARQGEDFTASEEFQEEACRRAEAANLDVRVMERSFTVRSVTYQTVTFQFRPRPEVLDSAGSFPTPPRRVKDQS